MYASESLSVRLYACVWEGACMHAGCAPYLEPIAERSRYAHTLQCGAGKQVQPLPEALGRVDLC